MIIYFPFSRGRLKIPHLLRGVHVPAILFARGPHDLLLLHGGQDHLVQEGHLPDDGRQRSQAHKGAADVEVEEKGRREKWFNLFYYDKRHYMPIQDLPI